MVFQCYSVIIEVIVQQCGPTNARNLPKRPVSKKTWIARVRDHALPGAQQKFSRPRPSVASNKRPARQPEGKDQLLL